MASNHKIVVHTADDRTSHRAKYTRLFFVCVKLCYIELCLRSI